MSELDVDFAFVTIDPTKGELESPAFLAINLAANLLALADDDLVFTDSVLIVLYLAENTPTKAAPKRIMKTLAT